MKILALDLGKSKSAVCLLQTVSMKDRYTTIPTTPFPLMDLLERQRPDLVVGVLARDSPGSGVMFEAHRNMIDRAPALTCDTQIRPVYDAWNRLVAVKDDVDGAPHDYVAVYRYNGLHQRVRRFVGFDPDNGPWYDYYYNPSWQLLEVRDSEDPQPLDQYLWGANYIDAAVVRWHDGNLDGDLNDQGDNTLYYTYDANFNVTALVKTDGGVAERYAYEPYGQVTVLNGASGAEKDSGVSEWSADADNASDWGNEILYCGYRRDETGLYYVRNRYYHPRLGRWMSRDPIGYDDGMNFCQYLKSNAIGWSDPMGLGEVKKAYDTGCKCLQVAKKATNAPTIYPDWVNIPGLGNPIKLGQDYTSLNVAFLESLSDLQTPCGAWFARTFLKISLVQAGEVVDDCDEGIRGKPEFDCEWDIRCKF